MVDKSKLKPGTWIVQNLIKHQNDYMIMRVGESGKSMTQFDKMITFGISLANDPFKAHIQKGLSIPTYSITSKPQFTLLKNANKKYKRMAIKALFKN